MSEQQKNHLNPYTRLQHHVAEIARSFGRNPSELTLIAVSKGYSWNDVRFAYESGCRDFGENRIPEATQKIEAAPSDCRWHMIGTLQKNKVRKALAAFTLIHSVDTLELAQKISACGVEMAIQAKILIQVNTSKEKSKHGLSEEEWLKNFEDLLKLPNLQIKGLMTMAPMTDDEGVIRNCFSSLRNFRDLLRETFKVPDLNELSMGMSHDYPIAISEGATLLRVGTAIFGSSAPINPN